MRWHSSNRSKRKTRLEIFCRVSDLTTIVETIRGAAHTGNPGDGKIFAGPVAIACRTVRRFASVGLTQDH